MISIFFLSFNQNFYHPFWPFWVIMNILDKALKIHQKWTKSIVFNQKMVDCYQILTSFLNQNPILTLDVEMDWFWCWNLDSLESQLLTMRFIGPNHISLRGWIIIVSPTYTLHKGYNNWNSKTNDTNNSSLMIPL